VLVAPPDRFEEIAGVLDKWSLSSALIGTITDDGIVRIRDGEEVHVEVPVTHFIDECPTYVIDAVEPESARLARAVDAVTYQDVGAPDIGDALLTLLGSPNLASRRNVWEQYDHTILTNTVRGPGEADAAVLRIKGGNTGVAISMDCNSRYCALDPWLGAQHAIVEATRNVSCAGGRPLGITNCLNFGNPERSPANWQLSRAVDGMAEACRQLGVPIVSGNVSLYNETDGQPIQPTPMVGCVGVIDDVTSAARIAWDNGDDVYLIGEQAPTLGGSEYLATVHGTIGGAPPAIDYDRERSVQQFVRALISARAVSGVHDVADGGIAVALAELALASGLGAKITLLTDDRRNDVRWFGESASRVLIAAAPGQRASIESVAAVSGVSAMRIGTAGGDRLQLGSGASIALDDLRSASQGGLTHTAEHVGNAA
jgi:phosphoribosylformylglycinamidine synthase